MRKFYIFGLVIVVAALLLALFTSEVLAQDVNLCIYPGAMPSFSPYGEHKDIHGIAAYINDDNANTYVGVSGDSGWWNYTIGYTADVTFNNPVNINRVELVEYTPGMASCANSIERIYVDSGSGWTLAYTRSPASATSKTTRGVNGSWSNVVGVRFKVDFYGGCLTGYAEQHYNRHYLYELRAFGSPPYIDIGLRVYNSNISPNPIPIAAWPLGQEGNSPLRIYRDDNVYGIVLVNPGDDMDSGVRIQTDSGSMALMRYEE